MPHLLRAERRPLPSAPPSRRRLAGAAVVVLALLAGCGGDGADGSDRAGDDTGAPSTAEASATDEGTAEDCAGASVEERAALALVVALPGVTSGDHPLVDRLADTGIGGVMLRDENLLDLEQAQALVRALRERLGPDLLVAVDEEGGRVTSLRALGDDTPSARALGRGGADAAAAAGAELGALARSVGIDWIFSPVLDLDGGPAGGLIGDRSFGTDPAAVTAAASAFARSLRAEGVAVTLKHFPGALGTGDPHTGDSGSAATMADLEATSLRPFWALVEEGAEAVMVGHVAYPAAFGDRPASFEPATYELLRTKGFDGVVITDALGMGTVHRRWGFDVAPAMALAAGADVALVNQGEQVDVLVDGIVAAVERGELSEERLDEAVGRVLDLHGRDGDTVLCPRP